VDLDASPLEGVSNDQLLAAFLRFHCKHGKLSSPVAATLWSIANRAEDVLKVDDDDDGQGGDDAADAPGLLSRQQAQNRSGAQAKGPLR
jgi:hypothetical protein